MHTFPVAPPLLLLGFAAGLYALPLHAAPPLPAPYEDLVQVKSRNLDAVYLLPGADFRAYSKVMIDPPQVSFRKDWVKEANRSRGTSRRITEQDAQQIAQAARSGFESIFAAAFREKGYDVVTNAAPDVLRLSPAIANLYINAPLATAGPGVSRTYTVEAGEATLALEVRDSTTGALMGLAVDRSTTRRSSPVSLTTSGSNRADFEDLFRRWATICVKGLEQLKTTSPVSRTGPDKKR
ncbi:MAG TPA: DUF3313 family protein [Casimicrobiaceae bacterium]|nr:DUF3313 family protein [Casimicrobiaceae bacterium]